MPLSCARCGKTNLDLARACYHCGEALSGAGPNSLLGKIILGNYRLLQVLGQGGMSVVYKAQHRVTEQEVAIKILPPDLAVYDDVKARFVEEARTLAKLEHANIVHLYNFVETDGRLHLVMQYAEGTTFEHQIAQRGRIPWPEAARVTLGVLDALAYAHARNVIHRDIKPSNVLVRSDGSVKVMDFGIAKMLTSSRLTATGQTMGTVRYMSPEQVRGKELDGRSDLYSLGVTMFEALTGVTPFDGESHFEIMQKHLIEAVPPLGRFDVEVPPDLERVLARALQKSLEDRYPDAGMFRRELEAVARAHPEVSAGTTAVRPAATEKPRPRRHLLAALAGAAVLAASVGAWALFRTGAHFGGGPAPRAPDALVAAELRWREPHAALRGVTLAVDRTYPEARLRVLSMAPRNPDLLRDLYVRTRAAYEQFLVREHVGYAANPRPLNLAVVPAAFLRDPQRFPDTSQEASTLYQAPEATLFVADLPSFEREDLPAGMALHLCPLVAALPAERCQALADGFDKAFRAAGPQ